MTTSSPSFLNRLRSGAFVSVLRAGIFISPVSWREKKIAWGIVHDMTVMPSTATKKEVDVLFATVRRMVDEHAKNRRSFAFWASMGMAVGRYLENKAITV